jgi:hypothetical protein
MSLHLKLEYWKDGHWYVGRLPQMPGVFSPGATILRSWKPTSAMHTA